ncbi:formyl transferase [Cordyceps javanica]|uniref:methionyl-tRNA formyltransferase n=1 Tax=Cordyceps javanica TaxID=43265 RepID=A0A545UWZ2_9HYPO|nr:formyl transferase [Cordyceps javanica]TQW04750.1 formyl transferase [Cordyceps javanica]
MIIHSIRRRAVMPPEPGGCQHRIAWAYLQQTVARIRRFATSKTLAKETSEALRILFCGSDAFSCESLKALHAEHQRSKALVERLEVMVLPGKRVGRGFKKMAQVPCKELAQELGLTIHERKTFRDWTLPRDTNLVVAVSFGLFVPPRILSSAKYGGLNVHPSLLPHLRGPAPIHHAFLRGDRYTGVSLQTLDPKSFDHGTILAQTPAPGVPIQREQPFDELKHDLAVRGAAMLVQGLRDGVHVPPHESAGWAPPARRPAEGLQELVHAPKTTKADTEVDWTAWRADDWTRRLNVFGAVWMRGVVAGAAGRDAGAAATKRVLFTKGSAVSAEAVAQIHKEQLIRVMAARTDASKDVRVKVDASSGVCYFEDGQGAWIGVEKAKMEGEGEKLAVTALRTLFRDCS